MNNKSFGELKELINENWHSVDKVISSQLMKEFENSLSPDINRYVRLLTESISCEVKGEIMKIVNFYYEDLNEN